MGKIISNEKIDKNKVDTASLIIKDLYIDIPKYVAEGFGPFVAAIYDSEGSLIAKEANSVILDCNSNNHAEMRVIQKAEEILGTYDLSSFNLKLYVTSEPCIMCAGGIIWSGIKELYYGVPSEKVEQITGFDEGFKQNWIKEFKNRGILVYGNIESELGECELQKYISNGNKIYKPLRK